MRERCGFCAGVNKIAARAINKVLPSKQRGFLMDPFRLERRTNLPSGSMLFSAWANTMGASPTANPGYNPAATSEPTWGTRFGNTINLGTFGYGRPSASAANKIIEYFNKKDLLYIHANCGCWGNDRADCTVEFQNAAGVTKFSFRTLHHPSGTYSGAMRYGGSSATIDPGGSGYTWIYGWFSFTDTRVTYTRDPAVTSNYVNSFTYDCDMSDVVQIKVSGVYAYGSYGGVCTATVLFYVK